MPVKLDHSPRSAGVLALVAVAVAVSLSGCSLIDSFVPDRETRDESGEITEGGTTDVFTLDEGDCIDEDPADASPAPSESADSTESAEPTEVTDVPTVPCTEAHAYEVYANVTVPDADEYPGNDAITSQADSGCYDAFAPFVGAAYEDSALDYTAYFPTSGSWDAGDRTINCLIYDPAAETTGSLAGAAR